MARALGSLVIQLQADVGRLRRDLGRAQTTTQRAQRSMSASADRISRSFRGIGAAASAFLGARFVRDITQQVDAYRQLEARIRLATERTGDFAGVQSELISISNATGASLRDTVSVFQSIARSAGELGASNRDVLAVVANVQKLAAISGASGSNLSAGLLQFSQAMASGIVRAEELNSLLENIPEVANTIARNMGLTVGQLRAAVLEGNVLSKDVFGALLDASDEVNTKFAKFGGTLGQATTSLQNALSQFVSSAGQQLGVFDAILLRINQIAEGVLSLKEAFFPSTVQRAAQDFEEAISEAGKRMEELRREQNALITTLSLPLSDKGRAFAERRIGEINDKLRQENVLFEGILRRRKALVIRLNEGAVSDQRTDPVGNNAPSTVAKTDATLALVRDALKNGERDMRAFRAELDRTVRQAEELAEPFLPIAEQIQRIRDVAERGLIPESVAEQAERVLLGRISVALDQTKLKVRELKDEGSTDLDDLKGAVQGFGNSLTEALVSATTSGAGSFSGLIDSMIEDIDRLVARKLIVDPLIDSIEELIDKFKEAGSLSKVGGGLLDKIGGIFGGLFSSGGGGGSSFKIADIGVPAFAHGGRTSGRGPILVGERGPEVFVPGVSGTVIPNGALGAAPNLNVNFTIVANDTRGFSDLIQGQEGQIVGMIDSALRGQGRSGLSR